LTLHFDAAGGIICKIGNPNKRKYLNALVSPSGKKGMSPYSYFEAVSERHDTGSISTILQDVNYAIRQKTQIRIPYIVIDFLGTNICGSLNF
jgi:hypothetical protein